MATLNSFTELHCWQACQEVKLFIMQICKKFPKEEKFDLVDNVRRAARSTTRNLAEGFGKHTHKENIHFVRISRGSQYEVLDDIITAKMEGYITEQEFQIGEEKILTSIKLTNGYIRYLESKIKKKK